MIVQSRTLGVASAFLSLFVVASAHAQTQPAQQQRAPALNQPAAPPTGSGRATMRTSPPLLAQRCQDLGVKFKALDKRNFAYSKVVVADLAADKGEALYPTNPERGIELIEAAYRDLGLQPPQ